MKAISCKLYSHSIAAQFLATWLQVMQSDFYHIIFWENDDEASNFQINIKDKSKEIVVEMKILI